MSDDAEIDRIFAGGVMAHSAWFSPDGRWLAIRYEGDALRAWDLTASTHFLVGDAVRAFGFTADSRRILTGSADDQLRLHDLETGEGLWRQATTYRVRILALHPLEPLLAVAGEGRTDFEVRSSSDGHVERIIQHPELGFAARWSADGRSLITAHGDFSVRVWDWPSMDSPRLIMRFHRSDPVFPAVDPADRWLATAGWDNQSALYDQRDGRML
jgi:WD40 repeat protein